MKKSNLLLTNRQRTNNQIFDVAADWEEVGASGSNSAMKQVLNQYAQFLVIHQDTPQERITFSNCLI